MRETFEKLAAIGKINPRFIGKLLALTRTGHVTHRSWGFGTIKSVDTVFSKLIVDFQGKPQHPFDLNFAAESLQPATADDEHREDPLQIQRLNWRLLPPGELSFETLRQHLQASANRQSKGATFDTSRLKFLLHFTPSHIYAGLDEFDGYLAFLFPGMNGAVLENPIEGNAVYVFDERWRELSKLTKSELLQEERRHFHRIVHTGDWKTRLKNIIPKTSN